MLRRSDLGERILPEVAAERLEVVVEIVRPEEVGTIRYPYLELNPVSVAQHRCQQRIHERHVAADRSTFAAGLGAEGRLRGRTGKRGPRGIGGRQSGVVEGHVRHDACRRPTWEDRGGW